jgi:hypothetical protein
VAGGGKATRQVIQQAGIDPEKSWASGFQPDV